MNNQESIRMPVSDVQMEHAKKTLEQIEALRSLEQLRQERDKLADSGKAILARLEEVRRLLFRSEERHQRFRR